MARFPKMAREKFLCHAAFNVVSIIFISLARPIYLHCEEYVYIYTYLVAYRMYMDYCYYQIIRQMKHFYIIRERCEVLNGYLSLGHRCGSI